MALDTADRGGANRRAQELGERLLDAIRRGDEAGAMDLLDAGAPIDASGDDGISGGHIAARLGKPHILRRLLEDGWDPNSRSESGAVALHMAAQADSGRCASLLLRFGADPDAKVNQQLPIR